MKESRHHSVLPGCRRLRWHLGLGLMVLSLVLFFLCLSRGGGRPSAIGADISGAVGAGALVIAGGQCALAAAVFKSRARKPRMHARRDTAQEPENSVRKRV